MPSQRRAQPLLTERLNTSGFVDDKRQRNRIAITGFVFAIIGLGFLVPMFGFLVFPFLAMGLIFSIVAYLRTRNGARFRSLALAGMILTGLTLIGGGVTNFLTYRHSLELWAYCPPAAVAPAGPNAEALIGDWALITADPTTIEASEADEPAGAPFLRYHPNGVGDNLNDGECFNWHADGTFSNANLMRTWHLTGDTLEIGSVFGTAMTLQRIQ